MKKKIASVLLSTLLLSQSATCVPVHASPQPETKKQEKPSTNQKTADQNQNNKILSKKNIVIGAVVGGALVIPTLALLAWKFWPSNDNKPSDKPTVPTSEFYRSFLELYNNPNNKKLIEKISNPNFKTAPDAYKPYAEAINTLKKTFESLSKGNSFEPVILQETLEKAGCHSPTPQNLQALATYSAMSESDFRNRIGGIWNFYRTNVCSASDDNSLNEAAENAKQRCNQNDILTDELRKQTLERIDIYKVFKKYDFAMTKAESNLELLDQEAEKAAKALEEAKIPEDLRKELLSSIEETRMSTHINAALHLTDDLPSFYTQSAEILRTCKNNPAVSEQVYEKIVEDIDKRRQFLERNFKAPEADATENFQKKLTESIKAFCSAIIDSADDLALFHVKSAEAVEICTINTFITPAQRQELLSAVDKFSESKIFELKWKKTGIKSEPYGEGSKKDDDENESEDEGDDSKKDDDDDEMETESEFYQLIKALYEDPNNEQLVNKIADPEFVPTPGAYKPYANAINTLKKAFESLSQNKHFDSAELQKTLENAGCYSPTPRNLQALVKYARMSNSDRKREFGEFCQEYRNLISSAQDQKSLGERIQEAIKKLQDSVITDKQHEALLDVIEICRVSRYSDFIISNAKDADELEAAAEKARELCKKIKMTEQARQKLMENIDRLSQEKKTLLQAK